MTASDTGIPGGLDRIKALMAWWGIPNLFEAGTLETQAEQYQVLVAHLTKLFDEACASQARVLSATNERYAHAFQNLLKAQQPSELMAAQSSLMTALMESVAAQMKIWAELTEKLYGCSTVVSEAGTRTVEQVARSESHVIHAETEQPDPHPKPSVDRQSPRGDLAHG